MTAPDTPVADPSGMAQRTAQPRPRTRAPVLGPRCLAAVRRPERTLRLRIPERMLGLLETAEVHRVEEELYAFVTSHMPARTRHLRIGLDAERLEVVVRYRPADRFRPAGEARPR